VIARKGRPRLSVDHRIEGGGFGIGGKKQRGKPRGRPFLLTEGEMWVEDKQNKTSELGREKGRS